MLLSNIPRILFFRIDKTLGRILKFLGSNVSLFKNMWGLDTS